MTDRLNEIKERLAKVGVTAWRRQNSDVYMSDYHRVCIGDVSIAQLITHCPSDIAWLIAEVEKERERVEELLNAGPHEGCYCKHCNPAPLQIETVTEFRCGTETVYTDGTKDFQWSE